MVVINYLNVLIHYHTENNKYQFNIKGTEKNKTFFGFIF